MALENQPLFQAPSVPKMGKDSSPLMKGAKTIGFSFAKPKLKASKMSFVRAKKAQAIKAEDLKGPETVSTESLATTLTETNRILVEIQNQLAIDFANRIAEKKQTLKLSRKTVRKKKLGEKEQFVERGVKLQKSANTFTKKVLAPVKGIFDKILEFLSIVGGGILLNNAWEWLKDENNRKNLVKIFQFLKTYWKEILIGLLTVKVIGAIAKLVGFANTLRKIFNRLKGLGRRPPGSGGTTPGPNKGGPSGGCGPVTGKGGCLDQLSATSSVANKLAETLFATGFAVNYFKQFAPKVKEKEKEKELDTQQEAPVVSETTERDTSVPPVATPVEAPRMSPASYGPIIAEGRKKALEENRSQSIPMPDGGRVFIDRKGRVKSVKTGEEVKRGEEESKFYLDLFTGLNAPVIARYLYGLGGRGFGAMFGRTTLGTNVLPRTTTGTFPGLRPPGPRLTPQSPGNTIRQGPTRSKGNVEPRVSASDMQRSGVTDMISRSGAKAATGGKKIGVKGPTWAQQIETRAKQFKKLSYSKSNLREIYNNPNQPLVDRAAARQLLNKLGDRLPKIEPDFKGINIETIPGASKGGTVFGQGSQTVDSVPAMLAPGEEVIRSASANIFRPVLKDINDNAGRMFIAFRDGVNLMKRNNDLQAEESKRTIELFQKFDDILKKEVSNIEREKLKKALDMSMLVSNIPHQQSESPFQLMSNNTVEQPLPPQTIRVIHTESDPSLNQYGHRRTPKEGKIETLSMNMAPNVIDLSQKQQQPKEQPKESSATDIIISPVDPDNPFFGRTFTSLGVEL